jgi:uncharacterized OB-fold protein
VVAIIGGLLAAFWVGLIIWTWRDIRSRSADIFAALLAVLLVAVFNVIGLLIYILVRPKQTLAEQYDRALEEEILLQELEQSPTCHNCGRPVKPDWQYCPYCEAELKHPCPQCGYLLEPEWKRCPQCGAPVDGFSGKQPITATQAVVPPPPLAQPETITVIEPEPALTTESEPEAEFVPPPPPATVTLPEAEAIAKAQALKNQPLQSED